MAQTVPPPFDLTYVAPAAPLPSWLRYTSSPVLTSLAYYTVATLDANGYPTLATGSVALTQYQTELLQLPLTVDVPYSVDAPYTNAGGTGPTIVSVIGESGTGATFVLAASVAPGSPAATGAGGDASTLTTVPTQSTNTQVTSNSAPILPSVSATGIAPSTSNSLVLPTSAVIPTSPSSVPAVPSAVPSTSSTLPGVAVITLVTTYDGVAMLTMITVTDPTSTGLVTMPSPSSSKTSGSNPNGAPAQRNAGQLSGGGIAGVVIGALIGAALLILLLLCWMRRRRARRKGDPPEWDFVAPRRIPIRLSPTLSRRRGSEATTGGTGSGSGSRSARLLGLLGIRRGSDDFAAHRDVGGDENESFGGGASHQTSIFDGDGPMMRQLTMAGPPPSSNRGAERGALLGAFHEHIDSSSSQEYHDRETDDSPESYGEEDLDAGYRQEHQRGFNTPPRPRSINGAMAATTALTGLRDDWQGMTPATPGTPDRLRRTNSMDDLVPPVPEGSKQGIAAGASLHKPKRRPVSEMGWLSGRASLDPSTNSSRNSSVPTTGTKSSGMSGGPRTPNKVGYPFLGKPKPAEQGSRTSQGSLENSPNVKELFYTTPRWTGMDTQHSGTPPRRPDYQTPFADGSPDRNPNQAPYRDMRFQKPVPPPRTGTNSALFDRISSGWGSALSGLGLAPAASRNREKSYNSNDSGSRYADQSSAEGMMSPSASAPLIRDYQSSPNRSIRRAGAANDYSPASNRIEGRRSLTFGQPIIQAPMSMSGSIHQGDSVDSHLPPRLASRNTDASHSEGEGMFSDAVTSITDEDDDPFAGPKSRFSAIESSVYGGLGEGGTSDRGFDEDDGEATPQMAQRARMPDIRDFRSVTTTSFGTLGRPIEHSPDQESIYSSHSSHHQSPFQQQHFLAAGVAPGRFISHRHQSSASTTHSNRILGDHGVSPSEDSGFGRSPVTDMKELLPPKMFRSNTLGGEEDM